MKIEVSDENYDKIVGYINHTMHDNKFMKDSNEVISFLINFAESEGVF